MKVITDTEVPAFSRVVTAVGNFDGVHQGHQALIRQAVQLARERGGTALILTFEPHPLKVLAPPPYPKLLLSSRRKTEIIASLGVDALVFFPFTKELAQMSAEDFCVSILKQKLKTEAVCVGYNFTFGYQGKGTPELLKKMGQKLGFEVFAVPPVKVGTSLVSSTAVREALEKGNILRAKELLGYWPVIEGEVAPGEKRGRELGFPTANLLSPPDVIVPAEGVYAAWVKIKGEKEVYKGILNLGRKPTFGDGLPQTIEIHIFNYSGELYGREAEASLRERLRGEIKFKTPEALVAQIKEDIGAAWKYLQE